MQKSDLYKEEIEVTTPSQTWAFIKFNIINNGTNWHMPLGDMHQEELIMAYELLLPKTFNMVIILRKQRDESKFGDISQDSEKFF